MNIQLEKARIIEQLQQINDADLIMAFKSLLEYSSKKQNSHKDLPVPEWHKGIVRKRIAEAKKHPEKLLSWEDVMKELDS
jgi:hypothetical protein